jgi:hypothetical protein
MGDLPGYVSIVFILTTFAALGFLIYSVKVAGSHLLPSKILIFVLPLWIFFQGILALGGFYQITDRLPPRLLLFGVLPALLLIGVYFIFFRESFISRLPLGLLTLLHSVRIPVEIVLYWLFVAGKIPEIMTFAGRNFDIVSGVLSPIVYAAAFRGGSVKRGILIVYNVLGIVLLANIVGTAIISTPSPLQMTAFDQPNVAVLYFPYIWLPTIVVPIVLFAHLSGLWKIYTGREN